MLRISLIDEQQGCCGVCEEHTAVSYFDSDLRVGVCFGCMVLLSRVERDFGGGVDGVRSIQNDAEAALLRLREPLRSPALAEHLERRAR